MLKISVHNVIIANRRATVHFKVIEKLLMVCASTYGQYPILIKEVDKKFIAFLKVDPKDSISAKSPAKAFSRAVKAFWL